MADHNDQRGRYRDNARDRNNNRGRYQNRGRNTDSGRDGDGGRDYDRNQAHGREHHTRDRNSGDRNNRDRNNRDRYIRDERDNRNAQDIQFSSPAYGQDFRRRERDYPPSRQNYAHHQTEPNYSRNPYANSAYPNANVHAFAGDIANPYSSPQYQDVQSGGGNPYSHYATDNTRTRNDPASSYSSQRSGAGHSGAHQAPRQASYHQGNAPFQGANFAPNNSFGGNRNKTSTDTGGMPANSNNTPMDPSDLLANVPADGPSMFGYACLKEQTWDTDPDPPDEVNEKPYSPIVPSEPEHDEKIDEDADVGDTKDDEDEDNMDQNLDKSMTSLDVQVGDKRKGQKEYEATEKKVRKLELEDDPSICENDAPEP